MEGEDGGGRALHTTRKVTRDVSMLLLFSAVPVTEHTILGVGHPFYCFI